MEPTDSNIGTRLSTLNLDQITDHRKSQTSLLSGSDETNLQFNEVSLKRNMF